MTHRLALVVSLLFAVASAVVADEKNELPVWSDINAIFVEHCVMCHSEQGAGLGLRLDSYAAAVAGSTKGPVLLSGNAEQSELVRRLRGQSQPRMPFLGYPLPEDQIDLIVRWVDAALPLNSPVADASQ